MPLLPNASVKTKVDFTRSRFEWKRQYLVAAGANIIEEGSLVHRVASATGLEENVTLTTVAALLRVVGVTLQSRITATTFTAVQDVTVPVVAPFTVQLAHTTLITQNGADPVPNAGEAVAWDFSALPVPAFLVVVTPLGPPPGPGQVMVNPNGLLTFDPAGAEAGHVVRVTYRYTLTAIERDELLRQSHVNRGCEDQFGLIQVGYGNCVVYTSMYNAAHQYVVGLGTTADANGVFSLTGGTPFGTCITVPTPTDPYLGVEYLSLP